MLPGGGGGGKNSIIRVNKTRHGEAGAPTAQQPTPELLPPNSTRRHWPSRSFPDGPMAPLIYDISRTPHNLHSNLLSRKPVDAIVPVAFAHLESPGHVLEFLAIFQTVSLYLLRRSVMSDLMLCNCSVCVLTAPVTSCPPFSLSPVPETQY